MRKSTKHKVAVCVAAVCFCTAAMLALYFLNLYNAANPSPSPNKPREAIDDADSEFPEVDWEYWLGVNPDIVGWITVPGTDINHPVVQAPTDNPDYYLKHDIYKNYNPMGCLYLDADCKELELATRNAVILGHHWEGIDSIAAGGFSVIADYRDYDFAKEHATVLIQTPNSQMKYHVRLVDIVPGWQPTKRCTFEDDSDYSQWYEECLSTAETTLDSETRPNQAISLVSCSYNYWRQNERTVVIASQDTETQALSKTKTLESQKAVEKKE